MLHYILKSVKIGFWILLPLFLISNTKIDSGSELSSSLEGSYVLQASGALDQELRGLVYFETYSEYSKEEVIASKLSINFSKNELNAEHTIGFFISRNDPSQLISTGIYEITENIEGLLKDFDGVFGFANVKALGEKPFFADGGKIVVSQISNTIVKGYVNVTLTSLTGERIFLKGNFHAKKRI